jgi:hypothetical protein
MTSPAIRRSLALLGACAATLLAFGGVAAYAPIVETGTFQIERPFDPCPDFDVIGSWEIDRKLVLYVDDTGTPFRDIERISFSGRLINAESGAWVADSGQRIFFDTLAPDGSFLTTVVNDVRKSKYVHGASRFDFETGDFHGKDALSADNWAALCEALSE